VPQGPDFPGGGLIMNKSDHQGRFSQYLMQINGQKEEVLASFPTDQIPLLGGRLQDFVGDGCWVIGFRGEGVCRSLAHETHNPTPTRGDRWQQRTARTTWAACCAHKTCLMRTPRTRPARSRPISFVRSKTKRS